MDSNTPNSETKRIELQGEYSVERSAELKSELLDGVHNCSHLELSLAQIKEVDLTFIQIICSLHRSCASQAKEIRLGDRIPECVSAAIQEAGFSLCCQKCPVKHCFLREAFSNE